MLLHTLAASVGAGLNMLAGIMGTSVALHTDEHQTKLMQDVHKQTILIQNTMQLREDIRETRSLEANEVNALTTLTAIYVAIAVAIFVEAYPPPEASFTLLGDLWLLVTISSIADLLISAWAGVCYYNHLSKTGFDYLMDHVRVHIPSEQEIELAGGRTVLQQYFSPWMEEGGGDVEQGRKGSALQSATTELSLARDFAGKLVTESFRNALEDRFKLKHLMRHYVRLGGVKLLVSVVLSLACRLEAEDTMQAHWTQIVMGVFVSLLGILLYGCIGLGWEEEAKGKGEVRRQLMLEELELRGNLQGELGLMVEGAGRAGGREARGDVDKGKEGKREEKQGGVEMNQRNIRKEVEEVKQDEKNLFCEDFRHPLSGGIVKQTPKNEAEFPKKLESKTFSISDGIEQIVQKGEEVEKNQEIESEEESSVFEFQGNEKVKVPYTSGNVLTTPRFSTPFKNQLEKTSTDPFFGNSKDQSSALSNAFVPLTFSQRAKAAKNPINSEKMGYSASNLNCFSCNPSFFLEEGEETNLNLSDPKDKNSLPLALPDFGNISKSVQLKKPRNDLLSPPEHFQQKDESPKSFHNLRQSFSASETSETGQTNAFLKNFLKYFVGINTLIFFSALCFIVFKHLFAKWGYGNLDKVEFKLSPLSLGNFQISDFSFFEKSIWENNTERIESGLVVLSSSEEQILEFSGDSFENQLILVQNFHFFSTLLSQVSSNSSKSFKNFDNLQSPSSLTTTGEAGLAIIFPGFGILDFQQKSLLPEVELSQKPVSDLEFRSIPLSYPSPLLAWSPLQAVLHVGYSDHLVAIPPEEARIPRKSKKIFLRSEKDVCEIRGVASRTLESEEPSFEILVFLDCSYVEPLHTLLGPVKNINPGQFLKIFDQNMEGRSLFEVPPPSGKSKFSSLACQGEKVYFSDFSGNLWRVDDV